MNGGCASVEEMQKQDFPEIARNLLDGDVGRVTPYGVVFDNNFEMAQLYIRTVTPAEEDAILHSATNRNRMNRGANDMKRSVTAEANLQDVATIINELNRNQEPLLHCAVFLELAASGLEQLETLKSIRCGIICEIRWRATTRKRPVCICRFQSKRSFAASKISLCRKRSYCAKGRLPLRRSKLLQCKTIRKLPMKMVPQLM